MLNKLLLERIRYGLMEGEGGGGGGGKTEAELAAEKAAEEAKKAADDAAAEEAKKKAEEDAKKGAEEKKFSQADLDRVVRERLAREKEASERKQREQQGEFQKLYDEMKPQYEATQAELQSLREIVNRNIDGMIKDWPSELKEMDPGPSDLKVRQAWVDKSAKLASKLAGNKQPVNGEPGNSQNNGNQKNKVNGSSYMTGHYARPEIPGVKQG